ncbi:MAG: PPOX class F420-dependent oxidoreductase [Chloroflexota bacterium]
MAAQLTEGMRRLLKEKAYCQIATMMPDGSPHLTETWVDTDGQHILINTAEGRQKERNIRRDARVAVNVIDPATDYRILTVRGRVAEITTEGADANIDHLAYKYLGQEKYPNRQAGEVRVILKIVPERILVAQGLD